MTANTIINNIESLSIKHYGDHTLTRTLLISAFLSVYTTLTLDQRSVIDIECNEHLIEYTNRLQKL
jgi:hypothetical protein